MQRLIASVTSSVIVALTLLVTVAVVPVVAYTQGSCAADDSSRVVVYENRIGDTSDGNDILWSCGNTTVLPVKTTPTYCTGTLSQWNNCVGSYEVTIPARTRFCAYDGTTYTAGVIVNSGNYAYYTVSYARVNVPLTWDNYWSSHRWVGIASSC
jgi:hypothetical protein